jgi:hypothetical protein
MICDQCETVAHCTKHGCVPKQPALVQQELVAIALNTGTKQGVKWLKNVEHGEKLYTTPPAQEIVCSTGLCHYKPAAQPAVPLTDEQIVAANYPDGEENEATIAAPDVELIAFARAIEAKLRSKNNG